MKNLYFMSKKHLILINWIIMVLFIIVCLILTMISNPKTYHGYLTLIKNQQKQDDQNNVIDNNELNETNLEYQTAFFINEKSNNVLDDIQAVKYFVNNNWFYVKSNYKLVDNFIIFDDLKINTFYVPAYLIGKEKSLFASIINNIF